MRKSELREVIREEVKKLLAEETIGGLSIETAPSDYTKQTSEYVRSNVKRAVKVSAGTGLLSPGKVRTMLTIFYGDSVGPAYFIFRNGKLVRRHPCFQ